jgi:hypothetical protein
VNTAAAVDANPLFANWRGPFLPVLNDQFVGHEFEQRLIAEHLPGLRHPGSRRRFIDEVALAERRIAGRRLLSANPGVVDMREPNVDDLTWSPLRATVQWTRAGDRDEATWLAYLTTFFGEDERHADRWRSTRLAYSGFGEGRLSWTHLVAEPQFVSELGERHCATYVTLKRGNHRKYEPATKGPDHPWGLPACVRSLVTLADKRGGLGQFFVGVGAPPTARFDRLMRELKPLLRFKRTGCFDLLVLLGDLGVYDLEAPRLYLAGATGPKTGAELMLPGITEVDGLDDALCAVARRVGVEIQAMEDALCNWQKQRSSGSRG